MVLPEAFEPVFPAGYWAELARVVRREGLAVERVFARAFAGDVVGRPQSGSDVVRSPGELRCHA